MCHAGDTTVWENGPWASLRGQARRESGVATISRRTVDDGSPRYDVRYRDPAGHQRKKTFKRKKDAERFRTTNEADILRGSWVDVRKGSMPFAEWWEVFWEQTVNLRPSTRARDASMAKNHVLPAFGDTPLAAIRHADVTAWVSAKSAAGLAPATVTKMLQVLSKAMNAAVDSELIASSPCDRVKPPRVERTEMRFLTPDQVAALADAIDERYRAMVLIGAYCGLRFGEMAALRVERVDILQRRIDVAETVIDVEGRHHVGPPKTRAGRRKVPMPSAVAKEVEDHLGRFTAGGLVFPSPQGEYLRGGLFRQRVWQPACVQVGLGEWVPSEKRTSYRRYDGIGIHGLRHTAVAFWIRAGASPKEIAARAGHSSVVTVLDRYGHLLPGHEDVVDAALDAMVTGATQSPTGTVVHLDASASSHGA